jgi:hypothetical protein
LIDSFLPQTVPKQSYLEKLGEYLQVLEHLFVQESAEAQPIVVSRTLFEMALVGMLVQIHSYSVESSMQIAKAMSSSQSEEAWDSLCMYEPPASLLDCSVVYIQAEGSPEPWQRLFLNDIQVVELQGVSHIDAMHPAAKELRRNFF